jgi:hypothetical protein
MSCNGKFEYFNTLEKVNENSEIYVRRVDVQTLCRRKISERNGLIFILDMYSYVVPRLLVVSPHTSCNFKVIIILTVESVSRIFPRIICNVINWTYLELFRFSSEHFNM